MASSGISTRHPLYTEFEPDWAQLRDTFRGERWVKQRGVRYLPYTPGQIADGADTNTSSTGWRDYAAYRLRARFPEVVRDAVESMLGVMHHKPPVIELPARLEDLIERATLRDESLEMLLRRINEEQLVMGRVGLLAEIPPAIPGNLAPIPLIAVYRAEDIINWDDGDRDTTEADSLNLVVLNETEDERNGIFDWERIEKYRVLVLGDPTQNESEGVYRVGTFRQEDGVDFDESALIEPTYRGRRSEEVPFVFINTKDIVASPDDAPLIGLSNLSLTIYRGEADYRQALFQQGQDTLVVIGGVSLDGERTRIGTGARIDLPETGDAKFIGTNSEGIPEMRSALENDYKVANSRANALLETTSRSAESGEALRVRVAARTASLNQVAMTGAFGLQSMLRMIGRWIGLGESEVDSIRVLPNLDFVADRMPAREVVDIMTAKDLGAPLSRQSIHAGLQDRGWTDLTFEEEEKLLEEEDRIAAEKAMEEMERMQEMGMQPAPGMPGDPASSEPPPAEKQDVQEGGEEV